MPQISADSASIAGFYISIIGLVITFINFILIANTKDKIREAVESMRFEMAKGALILHCEDALSSLRALKFFVRDSAWRQMSDKCEEAKDAVIRAKGSATSAQLPDDKSALLLAMIGQLETLETQADKADRASRASSGKMSERSLSLLTSTISKQRENMMTVRAAVDGLRLP